MNILESIIGLPFVFLPGETVRELNVECLAVVDVRSELIAMTNVSEFGQELGLFFGPDQVGRRDPLAKILARLWRQLVTINRASKLESVEPGRPGKDSSHPGTVIVGITAVPGFAEKRRPAV